MVRGMCRTCYQRLYRREKPEIVHAVDARSKAKHADTVAARKRAYDAAHPEVQLKAQRKYREANREKKRTSLRSHYQRNKARYLDKWQRRNALKHGATVALVNTDAIYDRDGWICQICKRPVIRGEESLDHIVPLSRGGSHEPRNVQLAHRQCNRVRSNRGAAQTRLFG